jgi:hypothetical protein
MAQTRGGYIMQVVVYGLIGLALAMLVVTLYPTRCTVSRVEGFQTQQSVGTTSCPPGTRTFTDKKGNISCCAGTVNGNTCEGTVRCTFSASMGGRIPMCAAIRPVMFGRWIGTPKTVQNTARLQNGQTVYMIEDGKFTKLVTSTGEAKFYIGKISNFAPNAWSMYTPVPRGNYQVRF